jgi:hypothetical protein
MRFSPWNQRIAITGCTAALACAVVAPMASAQQAPPPAPVAPITLSPEESQQVCSEMVPKLEKRVDKQTERITAGPQVRGSVQWLHAKAQEKRAKGHPKVADRLDKRADRRAARVDELHAAKAKLESFRTRHCQPVGGGQ